MISTPTKNIFIGISRKCFGLKEALSLYLIRSLQQYKQHQIKEIQSEAEAAECDVAIGIGHLCDINKMKFFDSSSDFDFNLEKLMGLEGYQLKLSTAGLVYAKIGHEFLQQKFPARYDPTLVGLLASSVHLNRDFRKMYEYYLEVVDSWCWNKELDYPTAEKTELLCYFGELNEKMQAKYEECSQNFLEFVDNFAKVIGESFQRRLTWYMESYLPAFEYLCHTFKSNEFGVIFCNYDFKDVRLPDLLLRVANTRRLPRLLIRPVNATMYRLECVCLVKPVLYFPRKWVGKTEHIKQQLDIDAVKYIAADRSFAITHSIDSALKLANLLLQHAEETNNWVKSQTCSLDISKDKKRRRPVRSLSPVRYQGRKILEQGGNKENEGTHTVNGSNYGMLATTEEFNTSSMGSLAQTSGLTKINDNTPAEDENSNYDNNLLDRIVAKVFKDDRTVIGVPAATFSFAHVFSAALIGQAVWGPQTQLKFRSLQAGCNIAIGPGLYDYKDKHRSFSSAQKVNIFTSDQAPNIEGRSTVAGIAFQIHGKRAISKIVCRGNANELRTFLCEHGTSIPALIYRRVYRRLVHPIDAHAIDPHHTFTKEIGLLHRSLQDLIAMANNGTKGGGEPLSTEERLDCFSIAVNVASCFIFDFVRHLMKEN